MTNAELRALLVLRLGRDDCDASLADGFIAEGLRRVEREVRAPFMEKATSIDTTLGDVASFPQPTDYLADIEVLVDGRAITKASYRELLRRDPTCAPHVYAKMVGVFHLRGTVPKDTSLVLLHYARFAPLTADASTNAVLDAEPDLALYAALSNAGDHFQHEKVADWEQRYVAVRDGLALAAAEEAMRGGPMVIQPMYPDLGID